MKRILVPCDFSKPSLEAFQFAISIAQRTRGEVHALHTIELPALYDSSAVLAFEAAYMKSMRENAERRFKRMKEKWVPAGVKLKTHIEFSGLRSAIEKKTKQERIELIVMGTHGASGLKEMTLGSNAEKTVRNATVPVICLRKAPKAIRNIVFAIRPDLDQEDLTMKIKALQEFFKATLHILFVNTPMYFRRDSETKAALTAFTKRFMIKNYTLNIYSELTEEMGIINFVNEVGADLVAMRTHGRKGLAHLANRSISENVVNHINCPVWTYKIK